MAASRGKNYTNEELKQLCYSVLHISQDPCVGAGQRAEKFWDRVTENYENHKPKGAEVRGRKSLEGKWADIKHDVSKFIGCYQQVDDLQISGTNAEDTLTKAKELYKQNHPKNKNFAFESCFWILKECPRWGNPADEMAKGKKKKQLIIEKQKEKEHSSPSPIVDNEGEEEQGGTTDNASADDDGTSASRKRPQGTKRAKEELKRAKQQEDALKMTAQASKDMAAAVRDRVTIMKHNSLMNLLTMPIDNMEPEVQAFMRNSKLEAARKLAELMMVQAPQQVPSVRLPVVTNPPPFVRQQPVVPTIVPATTTPSINVEESDSDEGQDNLGEAWVEDTGTNQNVGAHEDHLEDRPEFDKQFPAWH